MKEFIESFENLAEAVHQNSIDKGFWHDEDHILEVIERRYGIGITAKDTEKFVLGAINAQKVALMHSELGELTEAQRKNPDAPCTKVPEITAQEEELADVVIRIMDYAKRRNLNVGKAIVLKAAYNCGRPYMHGKNY